METEFWSANGYFNIILFLANVTHILRWSFIIFVSASLYCSRKLFSYALYLKKSFLEHIFPYSSQLPQTFFKHLQDVLKKSRGVTSKPDVVTTSGRRRRI